MATTTAGPELEAQSTSEDTPMRRMSPWLWILPAVVLVAIFLLYPVIYTAWLSLLDPGSTQFVGLDNYRIIFTTSLFLQVLRNNIIWLILGTILTVFLGLVIAVLVDRTRIENLAKAAIFIPMAISFVGAGVIWKFVYAYNPPGTQQIGLLNAIVTKFGGAPQAWLTSPGINNLALIVIYVWIWTGFCMVILSAALKSIPVDVLEAARVDGASEVSIFFRVIVPLISPTIAVVATTMVINLLKIFDIIYVTTGGNYGTDVVALEYYVQAFNFNDFGVSSALAVILLLAIIPVMVINIRRFREQEARR
ncbi:MAG TPA: sugar ABC transporter permease [Ktedonobacterales bacterium]|nr:sugar ABC transporter permease [Ktedonobacterales bacterium]